MLTSILRNLQFFAGACLLVFAASTTSSAKEPGYVLLDVQGTVQLEVPANWTVKDAEHRRLVKEVSESLLEIKDQHSSSVSVHSEPTPSKLIVRVSLLELDPPFTQAEVRNDIRVDRQGVESDLAAMWEKDAPVMWAGLAKIGLKEVGRASVAVEPLGGQMAYVFRYGRTLANNLDGSMKVAQYHIPLGGKKVLITLSYVDGDAATIAAHDKLKASILIH